MNDIISKRIWLLAGLVIAGSLAWIATGGFSPRASASEAGAVVKDAAALAQAREHLSVLTRPARAGDDTIAEQIAETPLVADDPVDLDSARIVRGVGRTTWLASSSDGRAVCEIAAGAMACPPVEEIVERGLSPVIFSRAGEPVHVSGVASDEVSSVEVILADGSTTEVPVVENLFTLDVKVCPRGLRWVGPHGSESFAFPQLAG